MTSFVSLWFLTITSPSNFVITLIKPFNGQSYNNKASKYLISLIVLALASGVVYLFALPLCFNLNDLAVLFNSLILSITNTGVIFGSSLIAGSRLSVEFPFLESVFSSITDTAALNPLTDLDFSTNTDCEDLAAFASDVLEFSEQDKSALIDWFTDFRKMDAVKATAAAAVLSKPAFTLLKRNVFKS